jgi:molecular chaperone GrpE
MTEEEQEQPTLEEELERLRQESEEFRDKYVRSLAESENVRKRSAKERLDGAQHAIADVLGEFLLPLDHFETALKHAEASSDEVKNWAIGFEMILAQFKTVLAAHNITEIAALGQHFDAHQHEAVEMVETDEAEEGTIVEEVLRGYRMGDRIVRASRVKVAKRPTQEEEKKDEQE